MDVKELRIGNYVTGVSGDICTVESISSILNEENEVIKYRIDLYSIDTDMREFNSNPKSITINEDWLLKFGFTHVHDDLYKLEISSNDTAFIFVDLYRYSVNMGISINNQRIYMDKKHVHQLQNLYYTLRGTELKLKQS